jgi:hypothetical protein
MDFHHFAAQKRTVKFVQRKKKSKFDIFQGKKVKLAYIRVFCKVRNTQHQNSEFGHTEGEMKRKPAKKYISIQ